MLRRVIRNLSYHCWSNVINILTSAEDDIKAGKSSEGQVRTRKMQWLSISALSLVFALSAQAASLEKRATGGYVQDPAGSASFTMYSGCSAPGAFSLNTLRVFLANHCCSLRYICNRIHGSHGSTVVRFCCGTWGWRCLWPVLCCHSDRRSLLSLFHWAFPDNRRKGD